MNIGHVSAFTFYKLFILHLEFFVSILIWNGILKSLLFSSFPSLAAVKNLTKGEHELNVFEKEKLLAHLDYLNVNTFEASDLEKLIVQVCWLVVNRKRNLCV